MKKKKMAAGIHLGDVISNLPSRFSIILYHHWVVTSTSADRLRRIWTRKFSAFFFLFNLTWSSTYVVLRWMPFFIFIIIRSLSHFFSFSFSSKVMQIGELKFLVYCALNISLSLYLVLVRIYFTVTPTGNERSVCVYNTWRATPCPVESVIPGGCHRYKCIKMHIHDRNDSYCFRNS